MDCGEVWALHNEREHVWSRTSGLGSTHILLKGSQLFSHLLLWYLMFSLCVFCQSQMSQHWTMSEAQIVEACPYDCMRLWVGTSRHKPWYLISGLNFEWFLVWGFFIALEKEVPTLSCTWREDHLGIDLNFDFPFIHLASVFLSIRISPKSNRHLSPSHIHTCYIKVQRVLLIDKWKW